MGLCMYTKNKDLITSEHKPVYHKKHGYTDCMGKHCQVPYVCERCKKQRIICKDCVKKTGTTVYVCVCKHEKRMYNIFETFDLKKNHKCKDHNDGISHAGSTFYKCSICYKGKCYGCGKRVFGCKLCPQCSNKCTTQKRYRTNPLFHCPMCKHEHHKGLKCNHVTSSYGTINNGLNYYSAQFSNICDCCF